MNHEEWRPINLFPPIHTPTLEQFRGAEFRFADIAKFRADLRRSYEETDGPFLSLSMEYPSTNGNDVE